MVGRPNAAFSEYETPSPRPDLKRPPYENTNKPASAALRKTRLSSNGYQNVKITMLNH